MKRLALAIAAVAIASSLSLSACGNREQKPAQAPPSPEAPEQTPTQALPSPEAIEPEIPSEKETYQQQMASELQSLNSQITQLQVQAEQADAAARAQLNEQIAELLKKMQVRAQLNAELDKEMSKLLKQLQTQAKPNKQLGELLQKQKAVQQQFEQLQFASADSWEELKPKIESAIKDLQTSYQQVTAVTKPEIVVPTEPEIVVPTESEIAPTQSETVPTESEIAPTESEIAPPQ